MLDCAGDLRVGGRAGVLRPVHVAAPFGASPLLTFALSSGAVATSGISHRSWIDGDGRPAHHLLDPRTGAPVFTGIVQATAMAPTAAQAEVLAKAAVLSGPARAAEWLRHGGVIVSEDGSYVRVEPAGRPRRARRGPRVSASHATRSASTASRSGSLRISWKRPS